MAELEVVKHTEKVVAVAKDKTMKWQHKLQEILLEVAIIVFAVSLSIWFHNWSESRKDGSEAREFLSGLKKDLQADMEEMRDDEADYRKRQRGTAYFETVNQGAPLVRDSLQKYTGVFFDNTQIDPRISRYEALKSSGKLGIIENKELLLNITDLYTKDFTRITRRNDYFNNARQQLIIPYLVSHLKIDSTGLGGNWEEVLRAPIIGLMGIQGKSLNGNIEAYDIALRKCDLIIKEIDEELK
jgi:hypothetical protein